MWSDTGSYERASPGDIATIQDASALTAAASADIDDRATARAARARSRRIPRVSTLPPPDGSHESAQVSDDLTIDDGWETWRWPGKARSGKGTRGRRGELSNCAPVPEPSETPRSSDVVFS